MSSVGNSSLPVQRLTSRSSAMVVMEVSDKLNGPCSLYFFIVQHYNIISSLVSIKLLKKLRECLADASVLVVCMHAPFVGPDRWNKLPERLRESASLNIFKRDLKTHLFSNPL